MNKERLKPSFVKKAKEELFSNILKEKVTVAPLSEFQNCCDVVFEKDEEIKAYKLFYLLTKSSHPCEDMRIIISPVDGKVYLIISYEDNITEKENI